MTLTARKGICAVWKPESLSARHVPRPRRSSTSRGGRRIPTTSSLAPLAEVLSDVLLDLALARRALSHRPGVRPSELRDRAQRPEPYVQLEFAATEPWLRRGSMILEFLDGRQSPAVVIAYAPLHDRFWPTVDIEEFPYQRPNARLARLQSERKWCENQSKTKKTPRKIFADVDVLAHPYNLAFES